MKIKISAVIFALLLTGCLSTSKPNYYYSNGYGNIDIPLENNSNVRIPIGKSSGKIRISHPNGYFSF